MKYPSFEDMLTMFKEHDYVVIGYIKGLRKVSLS